MSYNLRRKFNYTRNYLLTRSIHLRLKSGITIGRRRRIALYFEIRSSLCGRKSWTLSQTYVQERISQTQRSPQVASARQVVLPWRFSAKRGRSYFLVRTAVLPTNGLLPHEKFIRIESGVIQTDRVSSNREYSASARNI